MPRKIYRKDTSYITDMINNANSILQTATSIYTREKQLSEAAYNAQANVYAEAWNTTLTGDGTDVNIGILNEMVLSPNTENYQALGDSAFEEFWTADTLVAKYGGTQKDAERFISENMETMRNALNVQIGSIRNAQTELQIKNNYKGGVKLAARDVGKLQDYQTLDGKTAMSDALAKATALYNDNVASIDRLGNESPSMPGYQDMIFQDLTDQTFRGLADARAADASYSKDIYLADIEQFIDDAGSVMNLSDPSVAESFRVSKEQMLDQASSHWDQKVLNLGRIAEEKGNNAKGQYLSYLMEGKTPTDEEALKIIFNVGLSPTNKYEQTQINAFWKETGITNDAEINRKVAAAIATSNLADVKPEDYVSRTLGGSYIANGVDISEDATSSEIEMANMINGTLEERTYLHTSNISGYWEKVMQENGITSEEEIDAFMTKANIIEKSWGITSNSRGSGGLVISDSGNIPSELTDTEALIWGMFSNPQVSMNDIYMALDAGSRNGTVSNTFISYVLNNESKRADLATPVMKNITDQAGNYIDIALPGTDNSELRNEIKYHYLQTPEGMLHLKNLMDSNPGGNTSTILEADINSFISTMTEDKLAKDITKALTDMYSELNLNYSEPLTVQTDIQNESFSSLYQQTMQGGNLEMFIRPDAVATMKMNIYTQRAQGTAISIPAMRDIAAEALYETSWSELSDDQRRTASINLVQAMGDAVKLTALNDGIGDDLYEIRTQGYGLAGLDKNGYIYIPISGSSEFLVGKIDTNSPYYKLVVQGGYSGSIPLDGLKFYSYDPTQETWLPDEGGELRRISGRYRNEPGVFQRGAFYYRAGRRGSIHLDEIRMMLDNQSTLTEGDTLV